MLPGLSSKKERWEFGNWGRALPNFTSLQKRQSQLGEGEALANDATSGQRELSQNRGMLAPKAEDGRSCDIFWRDCWPQGRCCHDNAASLGARSGGSKWEFESGEKESGGWGLNNGVKIRSNFVWIYTGDHLNSWSRSSSEVDWLTTCGCCGGISTADRYGQEMICS